MFLTVNVPDWMSASDARREVRTLINDQCCFMTFGPGGQDFDEGDIRVKSIAPARART